MEAAVTIDDVERAARTIAGRVHRTPLLRSGTLSEQLDADHTHVGPELSTALHDGLAAGHSVPVIPASKADALSAPFAGENCVQLCAALGVESVLVSDDDLCDAFRWLYARMKVACELGAAASTAALLSRKIVVEPGQNVVAVVSGGNVAPQQAAAILASR